MDIRYGVNEQKESKSPPASESNLRHLFSKSKGPVAMAFNIQCGILILYHLVSHRDVHVRFWVHVTILGLLKRDMSYKMRASAFKAHFTVTKTDLLGVIGRH